MEKQVYIYFARSQNHINELLKVINFQDVDTLLDIIGDDIDVVKFNTNQEGKIKITGLKYSDGFSIDSIKYEKGVHYLVTKDSNTKLISYSDSWYNLTFYTDNLNNKLKDIKSVKIDDNVFEVEKITETGSYSDHGHQYNYSTYNYNVIVPTVIGNMKKRLNQLIDEGVKVYFVC